MSDKKETVTGIAFGLAALAISSPVMLAAGVKSALEGGDFGAGMSRVFDKVSDAAIEFGDKHHDTIVKTAVATAVTFLTKEALDKTVHPNSHARLHRPSGTDRQPGA